MNDKTIGQMLDEYNKLGNEKLVQQFGSPFRPRASFKDKADAAKSLAKLQETIAASEAGYATQEAQTSGGGEIVEVTVEKEKEAMVANGRKTTNKTKAKKVKSAAPGRGRKSPFTEDQKISLLVKDNPRREGTAVFKQYEIARKSPTVGAYLKAGGRLASLHKSIKKGWLKVS